MKPEKKKKKKKLFVYECMLGIFIFLFAVFVLKLFSRQTLKSQYIVWNELWDETLIMW